MLVTLLVVCEVAMLVGLIGGCKCSGSSHCWFNIGSWLRFSSVRPGLLDALSSCSVASGGH